MSRNSPSSKRRRERPLEIVTDPAESAKAAGLRYVSDQGPGIHRRGAGRGFVYRGPDGRAVRDPEVLRRIRRLAIPPAWTDVWISAIPNGHVQAAGRDARGRKQYRYHARWREARDETKFTRMLAFAEALPRIRARVERDLALPGLPREKVLATVVRLLETTLIRVGNEAYARDNGSFGLTTLRARHVDVDGSTLRFEFRGKSGKPHGVAITDRRLARIVRQCQDLPGYELFQYVDEHGERQSIDSADVNAYLRDASGDDFTAKDFRTWAGTLLAAMALMEAAGVDGHPGGAPSAAESKRQVVRAVERVARVLGNTPAICRKSYVHPAVIETFLENAALLTARPPARLPGLSSDEIAVLALLRERLEREPAARAA